MLIGPRPEGRGLSTHTGNVSASGAGRADDADFSVDPWPGRAIPADGRLKEA
jgi:hypothetical protein